MRHQLADLLNIPRLQSALDSLYIASKIPSAVIDNEGLIHTGSGWQDVCTKFHRVHPEARKRCIESDLYITDHIREANSSITYNCPHGLVDSATPIFIEGEHIGNVFTGQLFLEEPDLDHFRAQAKAFGFDEEKYIDAVRKVPIITKQAFQENLAFVAHLTGMLAEMGLKRAREMEAEKRLRESEERYRAVVDGLPDVVMRFDRDGRHLFVSENVSNVVNLPAAQFIGKTHSELGFSETQVRFWEEAIRGVFDSGAPYETEFTLEGNQGPVVFNWRLVPERDAQGIVRSVLSFKRDITDHRRAEEKLLQSEKKVLESQYFLQAVVDGTTDAIFVKDLQGRYRLFNNAASAYTRKTIAEVIGNDDTTLFPADDARAVMEGDRGVIASGKTSTYEEHLTTTGGKKVTFLSTKGPIFDECGNVNGLFGISRDITGQKQAEESLRESEAKYRSLFEHMQEGCAYCKMIFENGDPVDFIYVSVNAAFETLTGLKDVVGKRVSEVIPGIRSSDPSIFETYGRVARTGKPEKVEIFVEALQHWFSISAYSPERGYFVAVFDIITDRKRSEEVARREISLRNVLLDNLPCIALIMKKQTREIVACNDLAKKYGAVIGESCYSNLGVPDSPFPFCLAPEIWETGESKQVEVEYMGKFWHGIWVPFSDDLFVHYIFEITDRKLGEREREKLQAQLQQAMKMEAIGRLAGGVAHDFNNLLTVITGYSELMLQKIGEESPMHGQLEEIKRAGERAASLTQQLLAFSRKQIIEPKIVHLDHLVAEMHKMLTRLIGEDIELHAATGKSLGSVKVDPGQFQQILMNLVVNARDAMPGGGKIVIETANVDLDEGYCAMHRYVIPGRFVMLSVCDTGEGMTDEVKEHIFEPFFTTKERGSGTGLGLATTYGAVKQAGGSIEVSSQVGIGTTFRIYLPRVDEEAVKPEKGDRPTDLPGGPETVLIVEDEGILRNLCVRILEQLGYKVLQAWDGAEALAVAQGYGDRIDLLLTDVVMPGMNGSELATQMVLHTPEMKVLFTSGYTEDVISHHGVLDEDVSFIGKPYTPSALARKVREVLDKAR